MISSLKTAVQGMTVQIQKQDQIANNLANSNTVGFKSSQLYASSFDEYLTNSRNELRANREIRADQVFVDYSEGGYKQTRNPLDVAIQGSGFFTTFGGDGVRYTRDGSFAQDRDGFLITGTGERVFGEKGFIKIDPNLGAVTISDGGEVMQNGDLIDRLKIADFKKPYELLRVGNNAYRPKLPESQVVPSAGYAIRQGYVETSNVDVVSSMTAMITANRTYESISKALQSEDQTLEKAINQVGRLG